MNARDWWRNAEEYWEGYFKNQCVFVKSNRLWTDSLYRAKVFGEVLCRAIHSGQVSLQVPWDESLNVSRGWIWKRGW